MKSKFNLFLFFFFRVPVALHLVSLRVKPRSTYESRWRNYIIINKIYFSAQSDSLSNVTKTSIKRLDSRKNLVKVHCAARAPINFEISRPIHMQHNVFADVIKSTK